MRLNQLELHNLITKRQKNKKSNSATIAAFFCWLITQHARSIALAKYNNPVLTYLIQKLALVHLPTLDSGRRYISTSHSWNTFPYLIVSLHREKPFLVLLLKNPLPKCLILNNFSHYLSWHIRTTQKSFILLSTHWISQLGIGIRE